MGKVFVILGVLVVSIVVLLCFFSCIVAKKADEAWSKRNDR